MKNASQRSTPPQHRQTHEEISLKLIKEQKQRIEGEGSTREVSCLALNFFYDYMEENGLDRRLIQRDLPYSPEYLDNRVNWIDYETFCVIESRLADHFDAPDLYYRVGCSFRTTGGLGFVRVIMRSVLSPFSVYGLIPRMLRRFLFPNVTVTYTRTARNEMLGKYVFNPGFAPSQAWIETTRGILSSIPTMMGVPPAVVIASVKDPLTVEFQVQLKKWLGPVESLRGAWRKLSAIFKMRLANHAEATRELESTNALLQEKVEELTAAQSTLTAKVRDLSVLNQLSVRATNQLDLQILVRTAVDVIHSQLGGLATAVLIHHPETEGYSIAATAGVESASLQDLDRLLAFTAPGSEQLKLPHEPLASLGWNAYPMLVGDKNVGGLLVQRTLNDTFDTELFTSLGNQLAVAIDNAQSYRIINDLRDTLEIRVEARTAQLEEARSSLEDTVLQLEKADRAKREFFTNVSHELKTPLTLIMAPLNEIRQETAEPEAIDSLERNAASLLRLVEEMLDFSRIDDGRLHANPVDFDLSAFTKDVVDTLSPLAKQRSLELAFSDPQRKMPVHAEPHLVRRILRNLVTNAIKYIDTGDRIQVRLGTADDGATVISVIDNGPGIPLEEQPRIFERFYRCPSTQRQVKGSGIGLAMARDLAELSGGSLTLQDTPGGGATFCLTLPEANSSTSLTTPDVVDQEESKTLLAMHEYAAQETQVVEPRGEEALTVLVVDDNPDIRSLMRRLLIGHYDIVEAVDGADGLRAALECSPDLILSDVSMPGMDGYEFCERIKASPETQNIPVLLVTARHGSEAAVEGFSCGADDYITKPFAPQELMARVEAHIRIRRLTVALIRAEKQASLGAMSAGIAHEILNPVNVVINAIGPLRKAVTSLREGQPDTRQVERSEKMLKVIESSGKRISRVVDAVMRLSQQDREGITFRPTLIADHLESVVTMLGYRLSKGYDLTLDLEYKGYVDCVPDLLDQAVLNLLNNAMDAMPSGGSLTLSARQVGDDLEICVTDTGNGIPDELKSRIFNPFFTTKSSGTNAGLGLALLREIVGMHSGQASLVCSSPKGSTFDLRIPLVQRQSNTVKACEKEQCPTDDTTSETRCTNP
jgi:signal transduction histidine kinase